MKKFYKLSLPLLGAVMMSSQLSAQVSEIAPQLLYPTGVSADGVVVMNGGNSILKWDAENGLVSIGEITNGYDFGGQVLISDDGKKITAGITNPESNLNEISLYDVDSQSWTYLGGLTPEGMDGSLSSSWGMSADGTTIVGLGWTAAGDAHGVKWDAANGMIDLGSTVTDRSSRANAINGDKTVIVGWQDDETGYRAAVRWVNGVQEHITDNEGNNVGEAGGVSSDGKTVIGYNGFYPYVWNDTKGYQEIQHPNAGMFFRGGATGISADGKTVIGFFRGWPGPPMTGEGFIWTEEDGRINLNDYVTSLGMDTKGITFALPLAISQDGKKIAGVGTNDAGIVAFYIDLSQSMATQNVSKSTMAVAPNPVKDVLNISGAKTENVEIYNFVGQKVVSAKLNNGKLDVSSLAKGAYIIKVNVTGKSQNLKFIKE